MSGRFWQVALMWAVVVAAACAPAAAPPPEAPRTYRIGILGGGVPRPHHEAFVATLAELGYREGANTVVERRYAEGEFSVLDAMAAELLGLGVDVIVSGDTPAIAAAQKATKTVPIVMANSGDPVFSGFVASLPRPGGNITGLASITTELAAKRIELIREFVPGLTGIAVMWEPANAIRERAWEHTRDAASGAGLRALSLPVRTRGEIEPAFAAAAENGVEAIIVFPDRVFTLDEPGFFALAARYEMPTIHEGNRWVESGGLMAYGPDIADQWLRAAPIVDRILKGASPADLPVQQPIRFELAVNAKTANALGLPIPRSIALQADRFFD